MKIKVFDDPYRFVYEYSERWLRTGVEDGGVLNLSRFEQNGRLADLVCLAVIDSDSRTQLTAFVDPADQIMFSRATREVFAVLVDYLVADRIEFPGIFAPNPSSQQFAEMYALASGRQYAVVKQLKHYELTFLADVFLAAGQLRQAVERDRLLLVAHNIAFQHDSNTQRPYDSQAAVTRELAKGNLYVWEGADGTVVSSGKMIPDKTARSGEISWIFTPQQFRGNGYATALTYMLSKRVLDGGKEACFLSADAADPSPNRVYLNVGFEEKCLMDNMRLIT